MYCFIPSERLTKISFIKFSLKLIICLLILCKCYCEFGKRVKLKKFKERWLIKPSITKLFVKDTTSSQST